MNRAGAVESFWRRIVVWRKACPCGGARDSAPDRVGVLAAIGTVILVNVVWRLVRRPLALAGYRRVVGKREFLCTAHRSRHSAMLRFMSLMIREADMAP